MRNGLTIMVRPFLDFLQHAHPVKAGAVLQNRINPYTLLVERTALLIEICKYVL